VLGSRGNQGRTSGLVALLLVLASCGSSAPNAVTARSGGASVARQELSDRPPIHLVARLGDPRGAVSFASTSEDSVSAVAVSALLAARLRERGVDATPRPHGLGFSLDTLVDRPDAAERFVRAVSEALTAPLTAQDPALRAVDDALVRLFTRRFYGPGDAAAGRCSGALGVMQNDAKLDVKSAAGLAKLRAWIAAAYSVERSAFAALGSSELLTRAMDALAQTPAWPETERLVDAWPAESTLLADFGPRDDRRLTLALRVADPDIALSAARALGAENSALSRRLAALHPPFRLERAVAVGRPRGACLRLDALSPHGDPGPSGVEAARALSVLDEELERTLRLPVTRRLEEAVTEPSDPREAAAAAAWSALVADAEDAPARRVVSYVGKESDRGRFDLAGGVAELSREAQKPIVDLVSRVERGQGKLWALFAGTCGTGAETANDAGEAATLVSALARSANAPDVTFEPWIASDGVGVLAHTARRSPAETPTEQAKRLGAALGELFALERPSPMEVVAAREGLLAALDAPARAGYFLTLDRLTNGHPSWLEPRGTFESLTAIHASGLEPALHRFLGRPLRLAVLANADSAQSESVRRELERLLRPVRVHGSRCPNPAPPAPARGEIVLETTGEAPPEGSYLAAPLPPWTGPVPREALATLILLNRKGGLLDQALRDLPATASARVLGGPRAAALIVQVAATRGDAENALAQVRALFDRLARGALTADEAALAERELSRAETEERLDPRRRAVDLYRESGATQPVDAPRLSRYLTALRSSERLLVSVSGRD
jgi:hypothetical protein